MKRIVIVCLFILPATLFAQNPYPGIDPTMIPNMSADEMQRMVQAMQKMRVCMESVKEEDLKRIEQRSKQEINAIKALCRSGKRSQAQSKALVFSREIRNTPVMKTIRKCSAGLEGILPTNEFNSLDKELEKSHVCDIEK